MRTSRAMFGVVLFLTLAASGCGSMLQDLFGPRTAPTNVTVRCAGSGSDGPQVEE